MTPLTVRRAIAADLDVVVALRLALLREYSEHPIYGRLRPDAEQRARPIFASQLESDNEIVFLAEEKGVTLGMLRCVDTAASPLLIPERYCYVSSVYVRPEARRHGVLRELFERARAWCDERGLTEMRLHNVGSRESSAAAWDSLGFEVVEQVRVLHLTRENARPGDAVAARREQASPRPASPPSSPSPPAIGL